MIQQDPFVADLELRGELCPFHYKEAKPVSVGRKEEIGTKSAGGRRRIQGWSSWRRRKRRGRVASFPSDGDNNGRFLGRRTCSTVWW